jgi:hypothetical protein
LAELRVTAMTSAFSNRPIAMALSPLALEAAVISST